MVMKRKKIKITTLVIAFVMLISSASVFASQEVCEKPEAGEPKEVIISIVDDFDAERSTWRTFEVTVSWVGQVSPPPTWFVEYRCRNSNWVWSGHIPRVSVFFPIGETVAIYRGSLPPTLAVRSE